MDVEKGGVGGAGLAGKAIRQRGGQEAEEGGRRNTGVSLCAAAYRKGWSGCGGEVVQEVEACVWVCGDEEGAMSGPPAAACECV